MAATGTDVAALWRAKLDAAKKTASAAAGRKVVHFTFDDGTEMVEEHAADTDALLVRKWRRKKSLGGFGDWEYEVGLAPTRPQVAGGLLMEAGTNPIFARQDQLKSFQWRIRNLPYPLEVYQLTVENEHIVLRTTNKKYYKKFDVPDLKRLGLPLDEGALSMTHANNTVVISYAKPEPVLDFDRWMRNKRANVKEGDVDCNVN